MVYHIKLTVESEAEVGVQDICNAAFKQLNEQGLTVTGFQVAQGTEPTRQDELILEKGLADEPAPKPQEDAHGSTSGSVVMNPTTKPASQIMPGDGSDKHKQGWSTKPSSITDLDPKNKTWDFGTKWI